jgi:methyl-accepting chemotaxis protein
MTFTKKIIFIIIIPSIVTSLIISSIYLYINLKDSISNNIRINTENIVECYKTSIKLDINRGATREEALERVRNLFNKELIIGKTGFLSITDLDGNFLIHKKLEGKNWSNEPFIKYILSKKDGFYRFLSPITKSYKIVAFRYLEEANFIIIASAFEDEFLVEPINQLMLSIFFNFIIFIIISLIITLISTNYIIKKPLKKVIGIGNAIKSGDLTVAIDISSKDEIGEFVIIMSF